MSAKVISLVSKRNEVPDNSEKLDQEAKATLLGLLDAIRAEVEAGDVISLVAVTASRRHEVEQRYSIDVRSDELQVLGAIDVCKMSIHADFFE